MKLLTRLKFPIIKSPRNSQNLDKESNLLKLTYPKNLQNFKVIKVPKNIRAINIHNSKNQIDNSKRGDTTSSYYNSIQTLLSKNLSINNNLKTKADLKKISSTKMNIRNKILSLNQDKMFRKNQSEENDISLFLNKLDRIYGISPQLKIISDINKELIKEDENNTNGNVTYNNTEEEQKDSVTYILDKNDIKKKLKVKLTKNNNKSKNRIKPKTIQDLENFHLKIPRYIPYGYENIRNIKFFQIMAQERLKNVSAPKFSNCMQLNDLKMKKFKFILKKKMKDIGNEMKDNQSYMKSLDKQIESCIQKARNKLKIFSEKISKE